MATRMTRRGKTTCAPRRAESDAGQLEFVGTAISLDRLAGLVQNLDHLETEATVADRFVAAEHAIHEVRDLDLQGLDLVDDSLLRRIEILGIEDSKGNEMTLWERDYRIRDDNAPVIDELPPPLNAPDAQLIAGSAYTITPVVSGIDNYPLDPPQGDLDRVEYFFSDPAASGPTASPGFTATTPPYEFSFVAAYAGNGIDTRLFPVPNSGPGS